MPDTNTLNRNAAHAHDDGRNRFAVIPTPERLSADETLRGRGVTIAFLDSGFYPHPDLAGPGGRVVAFHDVTGEETELDPARAPEGHHWHGTMVATAAAGDGRLSGGVYRGLASEARLVLVKVSERGRITEDSIARGIEWVVENRERYGIRVLNMSLGGDEDVPCTRSVIDRAAERAVAEGIAVVVAAGNSGCGERPRSIPPANSPSVITVGGYDDRNTTGGEDDGLYCSNYGPTADGTLKPEVIAPAMWVAAPVLPNTDAYREAEALARLSAAPDYALGRLARELWRDARLTEAILGEEAGAIREEVEARLRAGKFVAAHYQHVDGTSFAAPVVASVVAQMLEANPRLTPALVKQILVSTADRVGGAPLPRQGYGAVNARRAVGLARRETHAPAAGALSPPRAAGGRVHFTYHDDAAESVALAGDFNGWGAGANFFARGEDGVWRAEIAAPTPGLHRYKFVVDGARWVDDASNGLREPDEFGGFNSILHLA